MDSAIIFISGMIIGGGIELVINYLIEFIKKEPLKVHHRFHLMQRLSLISLPLWGLFALIITQNYKFVKIFVFTALIGFVLEYILGRSIHKLFGIKLWSYKYGRLGPYTSIYALPYWGGAGVAFALIAKLFGL